ncbi:hypothetical protein FRC09_018235, partial [Ceratobasidium sp. 395]
MHQWNWVKTVEMAMFLHRKWREAREFAVEQRTAWADFASLLSSKLTKKWMNEKTEAQQIDGEWVSPFVMPESLRDMTRLDKEPAHSIDPSKDATSNTSESDSSYAWITRGIELQITQQRIQLDVKSAGSKSTTAQGKSLAKRRTAILAAVQAHRADVMKHFPLSEEHMNKSTSPATDGQPEHLPVLLPSDFTNSSTANTILSDLMTKEKELRRRYCLRELQNVRALTVQRVHVQQSREKHARGVKAINKESQVQERLRTQLACCQTFYNLHRSRLLCLGMSESDASAFRALTDGDLKSLMVDVGKVRSLGEGRIVMPWYWRTKLPEDGDLSCTTEELTKECEEGLRVEWFKGRERYLRWEEEIQWTTREAASVILAFDSRAKDWLDKAGAHASAGWRAYCLRQSRNFQRLRNRSLHELHEVLKSHDGLTDSLCERALDLYDQA